MGYPAFLALALLTKEIVLLIVCALLVYLLIKRKFRRWPFIPPLMIFLVCALIVFIKLGDSSLPRWRKASSDGFSFPWGHRILFIAKISQGHKGYSCLLFNSAFAVFWLYNSM